MLITSGTSCRGIDIKLLWLKNLLHVLVRLMCGICGFFKMDSDGRATDMLDEMTLTLRHRGPDGMGTWLHPKEIVGLGHTRLSVIDLQGGKQPMHSIDGRYVTVFNGEIYNFRALRLELEELGRHFKTNSDTEVLLEAYRQWDRACLERFHGMFAFALFDTKTHELFLARDRTGIKPLYYYSGINGFYFGSELKAFLTVPDIPRRLNYQALADFLVLSYPVPPATFFSGIYELEPGTWLHVSQRGLEKGRFWEWKRTPSDWDEPIALEQSEKAIVESLQEHLVSDVPVGAFLSGGIDSSLLVALLVKVLGKCIPTFTVAFGEAAYDESPYARMVAKHLGTDHHEIVVSTGQPDLALLDDILLQFDQPFGDSSAIPTFLICREIRKYVKVVIGGDGGDEMFGGYERFRYADLAKRVGALPPWSLCVIRQISKACERIVPNIYRQSQRFLRAASSKDGGRLLSLSAYIYPDELSEILKQPVAKEISEYIPSLCRGFHVLNPGGPEFIDATIHSVLPGDYLRKVDMMSSAHGLEVRVPFLGERVLHCASRIPDRLKYSQQRTKLLLRKLAKQYLPSEVAEKPKGGFGIPLDSWLGEKGRREIQATLESRNARIHALIDSEYIRSLLSGFTNREWDHAKLSRYNDYQRVYCLWSLERWLSKWNPTC